MTSPRGPASARGRPGRFLATSCVAVALALGAGGLAPGVPPAGSGTDFAEEPRAPEALDDAEARRAALAAVATQESLHGPDHPAVAAALEGLAHVGLRSGDVAGLRPHVERALAIRERSSPPDDMLIARDLHFLSEIDRAVGEYGRALQIRERIGPMLERCYGPENEHVAVHLHNLALLKDAIGDRDGALRAAEGAVRVRERVLAAGGPNLAASLNLLGALLVEAGALDRAQGMLERALAIWDSSRASEPALVARALANLGRLRVERGEIDAARPLLGRALALRTAALGDDHLLVARSLADLGSLERRAGDGPAARELLRRAIAIQQRAEIPSLPELASSLLEEARLDLAEGDAASALDAALRVERISREHFQWTSEGLSEREALARARARRKGLDLALFAACALAERRELPDETASRILDEVIRSRALVLDALVTRHRVLALRPDPETASLVEDLRRARNRLTRLLMEGGAPSPAEVPPARLLEARGAADRAERALAEKSREFRRGITREGIGLTEIREALPPDSALLSYLRYAVADDAWNRGVSSGYVALVLLKGSDSPRIVPLGSARGIESAVDLWETRVSVDPRLQPGVDPDGDYRSAARRLGAAVWDPIEPFLGDAAKLFVASDAAMHRVNLATLVSRGGEFLAATGPSVQYVGAERDLVAPEARMPEGRGLLAIGDPAFDGATDREEAKRHRFDPLPGSRREVLEIASRWSPRGEAVVRLGAEADEASFRRYAPLSRVLHLATHAYDDSQGRGAASPLRLAGLALAGANARGGTLDAAREDDGVLTADEVALLDLHGVEWAVLSACATGRGELDGGEGILGLRRSFRIAGVRTLIVSLWPVEDEATRHWMAELYAARRRGLPSAQAVRAAALDLLDDRRRMGRSTHPYSWGSFVAVGGAR